MADRRTLCVYSLFSHNTLRLNQIHLRGEGWCQFLQFLSSTLSSNTNPKWPVSDAFPTIPKVKSAWETHLTRFQKETFIFKFLWHSVAWPNKWNVSILSKCSAIKILCKKRDLLELSHDYSFIKRASNNLLCSAIKNKNQLSRSQPITMKISLRNIFLILPSPTE